LLLVLFPVAVGHPAELAIGNIVRRVLHMIREEEQQEQLEQSEGSSTSGDGGKGPQVSTAASTALQLRLASSLLLLLVVFSSRATVAKDCRWLRLIVHVMLQLWLS
jgi:hypothetical protein